MFKTSAKNVYNAQVCALLFWCVWGLGIISSVVSRLFERGTQVFTQVFCGFNRPAMALIPIIPRTNNKQI